MIAPYDLERFRIIVTQRLGLQFDDGKLGFLGEVLERRLEKLGRLADPYLRSLDQAPGGAELGALAEELTVTETYFFRNGQQFRALAEAALPQRMRAERAPRVLSFLSAGCASGEEPYSLAIVTRESIADPSWEIRIRAVDLNPAALAKAESARYASWALRDTPPEAQRKWFRPDGRDMVLLPAARAGVKFEARNLAAEDPDLWQPGAYDVIFCRNVMMYFAPEQMRALTARIAQSLAPGGFLFLGHAETLRGVSDEFHLRHTHETFYYQRKDGEVPLYRQSLPDPPAFAPAMPSFAVQSDAWFDAIRRASERVAALLPGESGVAAHQPSSSLPAWDIAQALDLLRKERFAEALTYVRTMPVGSEQDPDVLLLKAMLLCHDGQLAAAEEACIRLLTIDEFNAGAHYVLALCHENSGDLAEAAEHDRVAVYLDPVFGMPRLHLGLLARRAGNRESARRELGQALLLLKREDASRLLLFGGGFSRGALISLCESALKDCGGPP